MTDWQPMETAPQDGTKFLWCYHDAASARFGYCVICWPEYKECYLEGWWMPLPVPPKVPIEPVSTP